MPYASEAQRRKMHELAAAGKIDPITIEEMDRESEGMSLPERVGSSAKSASQAKPAKARPSYRLP